MKLYLVDVTGEGEFLVRAESNEKALMWVIDRLGDEGKTRRWHVEEVEVNGVAGVLIESYS